MFCLSVVVLFSGCYATTGGHTTATEQIAEQTTNPIIISRAAYADALDAYLNMGNSYLKYKDLVEKNDPDLNLQVLKYFKEMSDTLNYWRDLNMIGQIPDTNDISNLDAIRSILLKVILELDGEYK